MGLVLPAVVYLCEVYERRTNADAENPTAATAPAMDGMRAGSIVRHATFGEGQVLTVTSTDARGPVVEVDFGRGYGVKRLLSAYAPLTVVGR